MQNKIEYFRLKVFGEGWQEVAQSGRLVFQNKNNIVQLNNVLPDLIFLHLADNNLTKLEDYFVEKGFLAFPAELVNPDLPISSIGVSMTPGPSVAHFTRERALEFINSSFGEQEEVTKSR